MGSERGKLEKEQKKLLESMLKVAEEQGLEVKTVQINIERNYVGWPKRQKKAFRRCLRAYQLPHAGVYVDKKEFEGLPRNHPARKSLYKCYGFNEHDLIDAYIDLIDETQKNSKNSKIVFRTRAA